MSWRVSPTWASPMACPSSWSATACQEIAPRSGSRSVRSKATTAARIAATLLPSGLRTPNQAVRVIAAGDSMLSPSVTRTLITHVADGAGPPRRAGTESALATLSPREREVLVELAKGLSNAEIGTALFMSEATVKSHVTHLFTKLDRTNRVQLAILAHDAGLA